MITLEGEAEGRQRTEALLWSAPTGSLPKPPIDTKAQVLPIGELHWADAERLFLRLLHTDRPVQYAKLFGIPGQGQAGIDAYARLPLDLVHGETSGRDYVTLQSRRVKTLTAPNIKKAVEDLLQGEWADRTATFYFATSFDLQDVKLDEEIRRQTDRLAEKGIAFVPWGAQEVSHLLKDKPRIVDDFFGRPWVQRFCGGAAAESLVDNLSQQECRDLRAGLRELYAAVYSAQGGVRLTAAGGADRDFVVLNVDPRSQQLDTSGAGPEESATGGRQADAGAVEGYTYVASRLGARRQSFRSVRQLLGRGSRATVAAAGRTPADVWLADGRYRVLIGRPGAGKSSLLRFVAVDLLSTHPQSVAIQRRHSTDLPIWLPFGFLCRHLGASTENSLVSAAKAWLASQSASHLWPLVERALRDDRLLLLVDGIDEWSDVGAAERALGVLEAFLGRTKASAILSTRPYAVDRLNWTRPWSQADVAPLNDQQRRAIASDVLLQAAEAEPQLTHPPWASARLEPFLDQLAVTPELAELSKSPLFLTLLAATWQGEPLPRQRYKMYARLVELLIEKHPQMRQRASHAQASLLPASDVTMLFGAVAYRLRIQNPGGTATKPEMRKLILDAMTDEDVLGYAWTDARRIADAVLAMAEEEFGLIVSLGAGSFGFLHRVLLDHLAGEYLATLSTTAQVEVVTGFVHDPSWHDVLLALFAAQVNPHATELLLTAALDGDASPWDDIDGFELLADALAAGVKITPKSQTAYTNKLIERVELHPSLRHRSRLITALSGMLANYASRSHLLPIMTRWLTAPRPDPSPTMWALRDLDLADDLAAEYLFWGMRHPGDNVKINAAEAIARRFGGQSHLLGRLMALAETGPSSATQAAAILSLGHGWSHAPQTTRLIDWARRQPSMPLRFVGLHLLQRGNGAGDASLYRSEERAWLLSLLTHESFAREPWPSADLVNIAAAGDTQTADFAFETLRTNGRNGGDRELAWVLACNAFAADDRFKDWVATEVSQPNESALILYNVAMIPQRWRDDPAFAKRLRPCLDHMLHQPPYYLVADLTTALEQDDAKTVLLGGLNAGRPYAAARTLVEKFADDARVRKDLTRRLRGDFAMAAPMAGVAIDVLGPSEGFAVLVALLRQSDAQHRLEGRVVVAEAVADAWRAFEDRAKQPGIDGKEAREVLASYDAADLAELCTALDPQFLVWHVSAVIGAWPGQPVVQRFAEKLIYDTSSTTLGLDDTIPVVILRAYSSRTDESSCRIVSKTLGLLKHIEPELREVLAFELSRSSLTTPELVDAFAGWKDEPDTEVRRTAFIGVLQAIKRHQQAHAEVKGADELTPEMAWLRQEIREELCAYGPDLDARRQLAWIGMLTLGDLTLIDGIEETIGDPGKPGVKLDLLFDGEVDQILVDLVADNWEALESAFGSELLQRLNRRSSDHDDNAQRLHVMSALATVATRYPRIADMLRREADTDAQLRQDRNFLLWAKEENRGDEGTLRALVNALDGSSHQRQDRVLDSLLDRDTWNVTDEIFRSILMDGASKDDSFTPVYVDNRMSVYAQVFPTDTFSVAMYRELEAWFESDRESRLPRDWDSTLAIAFGVAAPDDLPVVVNRAHVRFRMQTSDWHVPLFTRPLLRRLMVDVDCVDAFRAALRAPMAIRECSPIFADPWDHIVSAQPELEPFQRTYLFALALRRAGALPQSEAAAVIEYLLSATPDTVVQNPFTNHEGPLQLAVLDIA